LDLSILLPLLSSPPTLLPKVYANRFETYLQSNLIRLVSNFRIELTKLINKPTIDFLVNIKDVRNLKLIELVRMEIVGKKTGMIFEISNIVGTISDFLLTYTAKIDL